MSINAAVQDESCQCRVAAKALSQLPEGNRRRARKVDPLLKFRR
jgi:hypothetical protein